MIHCIAIVSVAAQLSEVGGWLLLLATWSWLFLRNERTLGEIGDFPNETHVQIIARIFTQTQLFFRFTTTTTIVLLVLVLLLAQRWK